MGRKKKVREKIKMGRPVSSSFQRKVYKHFISQANLADLMSIRRQSLHMFGVKGIPWYRAEQIEKLSDGKFKAKEVMRKWSE